MILDDLDDLQTFDELLERAEFEKEYKTTDKKYTFKELKEDIKYRYHNLFIFDVLYDIKNGLKNFWNYRSIIWNDRWYDYSYIFKLLEFKLKDTINNWDRAHYVGSEFTQKRMQILLNRIQEYQTNLENLQELYYTKKISKEEYLKLKEKLLNKTWKSFGRNITRFWD